MVFVNKSCIDHHVVVDKMIILPMITLRGGDSILHIRNTLDCPLNLCALTHLSNTCIGTTITILSCVLTPYIFYIFCLIV